MLNKTQNLKVNGFGIIFLILEPRVLLLKMHSGYASLFFEEQHITWLNTEVIKIQSSGMTLWVLTSKGNVFDWYQSDGNIVWRNVVRGLAI